MIEALDLALGVSTGAHSRDSSPELKLDTLRGHSPPVVHSVPSATASDPSGFDKGSTRVLGIDPSLLKSNPVNSTRTVNAELALPKASRRPSVLGAVALSLSALAALGFWFGRSKALSPNSAVVPTANAGIAGTLSSATLAGPNQPSALASGSPAPSATLPGPTAIHSGSGAPAKATPLARPAPASDVRSPRTTKPQVNAGAKSKTGPRNPGTDMGF